MKFFYERNEENEVKNEKKINKMNSKYEMRKLWK
jgi:hypothetical protein